MFKVGQRRWDRSLLSVSLLALAGCTAILDFSEPIGKKDGGAESDASDASTSPDASPAVCLTFEPNDLLADSKAISPMDVASAVCSASDTDLFSFTLADNGQDVSITLSFTADPGDDLDLQLLDSGGGVIVDSSGTGNTEQIIRSAAMATTLPAGTYHIAVKPVTVTSVISYSINLSVVPVM